MDTNSNVVMSRKDRIELLKLSCRLVKDIANTKDAFVHEMGIIQLREVHRMLGTPMPDVTRLGKDSGV